MRKVLLVLCLLAIAVPATSAIAGGARTSARVNLSAQLSVRVPAGWHVRRGWLSDVIDPAPRLAIATFPLRLSRHTCACGWPNVVAFPRGGAFVFVWEYLNPSRRGLAQTPRRPGRFHIAIGPGVRLTCDGPTDTFGFRDRGRVFQVAVYLGPRVRSTVRAQAEAILDSLRVVSGASAAPDPVTG